MIDRDAQTFLAVAGSKLVITCSSLVVTLSVGRALGPAGLGEWVLLVAAGSFLHTTLINWTHGGTVRFGCEEWIQTGTLRRTVSARVPLLAASFAAVALLLVLRPFDWLDRGFGLGGSSVWLVVAYAASLWIAAEAQTTMQALGWMRLQAVVGAIGGVCTIAVVSVLAVLPAYKGLAPFVVAIAGVPGVVWAMAGIRALVHANVVWTWPAATEVKRHMRYSLPMLGSFGLGYVWTWGDHVLLRHFATLDQVGYFGVANQIFMTITAANGILPTLVVPRLVAIEARTGHSARAYLEDTVLTVFVLWAIGMTILVAGIPFALELASGARFAPAVMPLIILSAVIPASVITSLYSVLFSLQERNARLFVLSVVMTTTNIVISVMLIPTLGAMGSAVGTALSYMVVQMLYVADQHRWANVDSGRIWTMWTVVVATGVLQVAAGTHLGWRLLWGVVSIGAIAVTARHTGAVNGRFVERLFAGLLAPVGTLVTRALVSRGRLLQPQPTGGHDASTL